jgi:hypothetical protein
MRVEASQVTLFPNFSRGRVHTGVRDETADEATLEVSKCFSIECYHLSYLLCMHDVSYGISSSNLPQFNFLDEPSIRTG